MCVDESLNYIFDPLDKVIFPAFSISTDKNGRYYGYKAQHNRNSVQLDSHKDNYTLDQVLGIWSAIPRGPTPHALYLYLFSYTPQNLDKNKTLERVPGPAPYLGGSEIQTKGG